MKKVTNFVSICLLRPVKETSFYFCLKGLMQKGNNAKIEVWNQSKFIVYVIFLDSTKLKIFWIKITFFKRRVSIIL